VILAPGKVLTNAHNLRGDQVTVTFADGRRTIGNVAGVDGDGDLAVIDVDTGSATALDWGDGDDLVVGSAVFGAGASHGGGTRVTFGLVSAVAREFRGPGGRRIDGSVEHTAPLAPGSSVALLDQDGRLVGSALNRSEGYQRSNTGLRARVDALSR
jgi:serine protease Do